MDIRNEMEELVRAEVKRIRSSGGHERLCWCGLCETDIVALSLTLLPPLYRRADAGGHLGGLMSAGKIQDAVHSALKRVSLRPKHRAGVPPQRGSVSLVNYTYEVGSEMIGPALGRGGEGCSCEHCRADALAYALNRYPAKYGVRQGGRQSLHPTYLDFMRHELRLLIGQAARVVSTQPRH